MLRSGLHKMAEPQLGGLGLRIQVTGPPSSQSRACMHTVPHRADCQEAQGLHQNGASDGLLPRACACLWGDLPIPAKPAYVRQLGRAHPKVLGRSFVL